MSTVSVRIEFFGPAREHAGVGAEEMAFVRANGLTLGFLRKQVLDKFPRLNQYGSTLRFAINNEFVQDERKLQDGDVVSVIPPVSGG